MNKLYRKIKIDIEYGNELKHFEMDNLELVNLSNEVYKLNNQVKKIRKNLEKLFDKVLYEEIYKEKEYLEKDYNMTILELREKFIESMINGE